jgi:uncharacterized protein (TIGR03437 family)
MKKICILLLVFGFCLLSSTFVEAQTSCGNRGFRFKTNKFIETADSPLLTVIGDFNKDGKMDIANYQSSSPIQNLRSAIEIQLGNGNGDFAVSKYLIVDYSPISFSNTSFKTGDFNGDGTLDFCLTQLGQIRIWLGNGAGDFGAPKTYPLNSDLPFPIPSASILVTDINGDGRSDVMFSNTFLNVLLATPEGGLAVAKTFTIGVQAILLGAADLNGDGKPEIVGGSVNGENNVFIFNNEGDGKFSTPTSINVAFPAGVVAFADFNGDQKPEILVSTPTNNAATLLMNNGTGGFSTAKFLFNRSFSGIVTGDFNKDGKQDFAFSQNPTYAGYVASFGIYYGDGAGNFPNVSAYQIGSNPQTLLSADFNKDGLQDFLIPDNVGMNLVLGEASGNFAAPQLTLPDVLSTYSGKFIIGDLTKDSIPDLLMLGNTVMLFAGRGNGTFKAPVILDSAKLKLSNQSTAAVISDFNKDGVNDLAIAGNYFPGGTSANTASLTILLGNSTGGFNEADASVYPVAQFPTTLISADFNADGFPDLVTPNSASNSVSIFLNNRNGKFLSPLTYPTGLDPQTVTTGDFNGDKLTDVVIGNRSSAGITLLLNDGAGGFTSSLIGIGANPGSLQSADVNGDGKQDLIIAQFNANTLTVLLGNGNGTFAPRMNMALSGRINEFVLTDITQDGKIDFIATLSTVQNFQSPMPQNRFVIFVGDGTGYFNFGAEIPVSQPGSLSLNDLNGDSIPDLAVGGQFGVSTFSGICNAPPNALTLTAVNAASYLGFDVSPEGIVAAFGSELSTSTVAAATVPLPLQLAGTIVKIKDIKGVERTSPLFFVSPGQVNFQVPAGTELGLATVTINNGAGKIASGDVLITAIKPAIFTANSNGSGIIAANALRVAYKTNVQTYEPLLRFDDTLKRFVGVPVLLPAFTDTSDALYLVLYGTGLRGRSAPEQVRVFIGGVAFNVDYAGSHCCFVGVDQINVRIYLVERLMCGFKLMERYRILGKYFWSRIQIASSFSR